MSFNHDDFFGAIVAPEEITYDRPKKILNLIKSEMNPHVRFIEARQKHNWITLFIEVKIGVPQKKVHDIKNVELLALRFNEKDDRPDVLALREDFPHVPHLNLTQYEIPKSLCLYEMSWDEIKLTWTAAGFLERIREWLTKTSRGELHEDDQALEPFILPASFKIILPQGLFAKSNKASVLLIEALTQEDETTFLAKYVTKNEKFNKEFPPFLGLFFETSPAIHGIIKRQPQNLYELHETLLGLKLDLLKELRKNLQHWSVEGLFDKKFYESRLALFVRTPHKRNEIVEAESHHTWVFSTTKTILQIGEDIGLWQVKDKSVPGLLIPFDLNKTGSNIDIHVLNPVYVPTRDLAAKMNGYEKKIDDKFSLIGLGTLGGSIFMNLIKTGFGKWVLVDSDVFLPHNFLRHVSFPQYAGYSKSYVMSWLANSYFEGDEHKNLKMNVLKDFEKISEAFSDSSAVLDCSASIPVARAITHKYNKITARRASIFLNPTGNELVILMESKNRVHRLDGLEMQYYRALCLKSELSSHLLTKGQKSRYARSCADVSMTISTEMVSSLSGIASMKFRELTSEAGEFAGIWSFDQQKLVINFHPISTPKLVFLESNGWQIVTDEYFIKELFKYREKQLPKETGSSVVGHIDVLNKIIYPFHTLPTPENSCATSTSFIRGSIGNAEALEYVASVTANAFTYLGEWHSHPENASVGQSGDDKKLLKAISSEMHPAGLPALMIIVGDSHKINFIIDPPPEN